MCNLIKWTFLQFGNLLNVGAKTLKLTSFYFPYLTIDAMISKLLALKWAVEKNLNEHLDIIQRILSLSEEEASEFSDWYNNHRTRKEIEDIYGAVESRAIRHTKTEKLGTLFMGYSD